MLCKPKLSSVCDPVWHNITFTCGATISICMIANKLNTNKIPSGWAHGTYITGIKLIWIKLPYKRGLVACNGPYVLWRKTRWSAVNTPSPHLQLDNFVHKFKLLNLVLLQNSQRIFPQIVLTCQQTSGISAWQDLSQLLVSHLDSSENLSCIQAGSLLGSGKAR